MIAINNSITINAAVKTVFDFLSTPEKIPQWNYYVVSVRKISEGNTIVRPRYHQVRKNDEQTFEITKYEENKFVEYSTIPGSLVQFKRQFTFTAVNNQCLVEDSFTLDTGFPVLLERLFTRKVKGAVKENLTKLKELLETGKTTLQDERVSYF